MRVGDVRAAIKNLPDSAPVEFRILSAPDGISIRTLLSPKSDMLKVLFEVEASDTHEKVEEEEGE
jgi:hypothetical protein